jgi:hypothetical protein
MVHKITFGVVDDIELHELKMSVLSENIIGCAHSGII